MLISFIKDFLITFFLTCACDIQHQKELSSQQALVKDVRSFPDKTNFLLHYSNDFCIYCITTSNFKRPSEARASRRFTVIESSIHTVLGTRSSSRVYVSPDRINEIFMADIISFNSFHNCIDDIQLKVDKTLQNLTSGNKEQTFSSVWNLKSTIQQAKSSAFNNKRSIKYELPYSDWLYQLTKGALSPLGFAVYHENSGCTIAPASEFIFGRRDLVIYNPSKCTKIVQALHIGFFPLDDVNTICKYELVQGVAELKVDKLDLQAENECFYNMFGEAIKLTLKFLAGGFLITTTNVYGILVAAHDKDYAVLLKLELKFEESSCKFYKCAESESFVNLFNSVIAILDQN